MAAAHHDHQASSRVSITKTVSVHPKTLHPQKLLELSNLDRQCPTIMYLVFFYKPSPTHQNLSTDMVFSRLKTGLEEALSVWYPAAGRLRVNSGDGKLNLSCNNDGAVLVEAVTQVTISELGDLSQYSEFYEELVFKPAVNGNISDMPLVVAQVTRFRCGGYSLGIGTSHSLFDGAAAYDFLHAWASQAKMKGSQAVELYEPVHERGLLLGKHRTLTETSYMRQNFNLVTRVAAIDHLYQLIKEAAHNQNNHIESHVFTTFHLGGAMIEKLKRKVFGEKRGSFSCSSFEVVAAHLWKARTKALGVGKERMVCLQFAVDTRNKMDPPLPKGFTGNAYVLASVASSAGELEEQSHESIVEKIREAKSSVTAGYVNAYIKALEGPQAALPPLMELTIVSDWTRLPFHRVDFLGEEAAYASPLAPPIPQVAYLMLNPTEPKSKAIDLRIGLLPTMKPAFSHYFLKDLQ
ncbi:brassinosteroid-related acyltransferase 1 isoform X1 [Diospyros lotus]|uniref:brassinosteroid-related acyltransferase 1 isoform X1 n=1 Tax=Diospyros lotus TaxID=55363 RepID=UPI0022554F2F|nr:brassinosteroid-related acyltransferase 1 isoform X1 [Diospyros lotus]